MEEYMLPCLNKKLFGIECLGCGLQRSVAFLFQGEFIAAFKVYPGIYPLLILFVFVIVNIFVTIKHAKKIKLFLIIISLLVIVISYVIKMSPYM